MSSVAYINTMSTMMMAIMMMIRTRTTPIIGAIDANPLSSLLIAGGGGSMQ